jgi:hypothetical protein
MKLSVDHLHEDDGFAWDLQALAQDLRRGAPFTRRLADQPFGGGTDLVQKAASRERRLKNGLQPPLGERRQMLYEFQHAHLALGLLPSRRPSLRAAHIIEGNEAQAPIQITSSRVCLGRLDGGDMARALPGLQNKLYWPTTRRDFEDGGGLPNRRRPMGDEEIPGQSRHMRG